MKQLSSLELEKTNTLISRKSEVDSLIEKSLNAHKVNNKTENKNLIFCKSYEKENFHQKNMKENDVKFKWKIQILSKMKRKIRDWMKYWKKNWFNQRKWKFERSDE